MDYRIYITAFLLWIVPNVSAEDCYTPDTIPGFCINLRNCESVLQVIYKYNQQKDPALVGFVQRSICGYDGYDILVCCPSSRYQTTTLPPFYFYSFTAAPISVPPQNQFSNFGPTFAPLGTPPVYTTPPPTFNPQPPTFPTQQPGFPTAPPVFPTAPPPISVPPVTNALPSFENDKCGVTNATHSRLVGGMPAQMNSWPWIALLGYSSTDGGPSFLCGGTLITQKHVLTAAHCIKATLYMVRLAEHDLSTTTELQSLDVPIDLKIVHEKFDPKIIYNDIALLKLSQIVPISNTIRPICLPWSDEMRRRDYTYYNPFLAGWGATSYKGSSANILQEVQLPILPMSECQVNYKTHFPDQIFDDTVLCVGYPNGGKDSCQGDSGGPLMLPQLSPDGSVYYFNLIGIVSYGYECARPGFPGIYTRVTTFIPWITQHIND